MKKIILSRHCFFNDGEKISAGEHILPAAKVAQLEAIAKKDPRTVVTIVEDLTPKESREVAKTEASKAEAPKETK